MVDIKPPSFTNIVIPLERNGIDANWIVCKKMMIDSKLCIHLRKYSGIR